MFGLGIWELIIILSIVVMLFGAKRLHDRRGLRLNDHEFQESNEDKRIRREKRGVSFGGGIFKRERRSELICLWLND